MASMRDVSTSESAASSFNDAPANSHSYIFQVFLLNKIWIAGPLTIGALFKIGWGRHREAVAILAPAFDHPPDAETGGSLVC
jgi:hypothetical protein